MQLINVALSISTPILTYQGLIISLLSAAVIMLFNLTLSKVSGITKLDVNNTNFVYHVC